MIAIVLTSRSALCGCANRRHTRPFKARSQLQASTPAKARLHVRRRTTCEPLWTTVCCCRLLQGKTLCSTTALWRNLSKLPRCAREYPLHSCAFLIYNCHIQFECPCSTSISLARVRFFFFFCANPPRPPRHPSEPFCQRFGGRSGRRRCRRRASAFQRAHVGLHSSAPRSL